ncbi:L,D-transpeptidase family protein [Streptomyces sp. BG9H]|uniref:L,D-transpeptidase family protein n=1 Tax=Streptomyces anatolicus TaxID=2675858 RepID=A0ABS6YSS4_9ACTN|nr:L,D-transpeptidase [Streptomyces anatolicus]MBW5424480.1 L,D-transpeptidase family protein [Streptomyces anatolicus]
MRWVLSSIAVLSLAVPAPAAAGTSAPAPPCDAATGPYQRELEREVGLPVDGRQSPADCEAIRRLQQRLGIRPADGHASTRTYRFVLADRIRRDPAERRGCPARSYRVTCVDLTRQILWTQTGRKLVFDPVPVRSGRDGLETRRGWHRVYWKSRDHFSSLYQVPMPFAQFFDGGQALHGTRSDLFSAGSGGCVNLALGDAERLYGLLRKDDHLFIWGAKPGTDG